MRPTPLVVAPLLLVTFAACCKSQSPTSDSSGASNPAAVVEPPPKPTTPDQAPGAGRASPDVPTTKSNPPTVAEWQAASDVNTVGANAAPQSCQLKLVREWLKVHCDGSVTEVTGMEGFGKQGFDYFESIKPGTSADFVVRVRKGNAMKLRIMRKAPHSAALFVNWPGEKERPTIVALQTFNG